MYIPEFVVGFIAGGVTAVVLITAIAWKYGEKEKGGED